MRVFFVHDDFDVISFYSIRSFTLDQIDLSVLFQASNISCLTLNYSAY
jgi:hypothetical protein